MIEVNPPKDPELLKAWRAGAKCEHDLTHEGMTKKSREVFDVVKVLAQQERDHNEIVMATAVIYASGWPWKRRLKLIWKLLKGGW